MHLRRVLAVFLLASTLPAIAQTAPKPPLPPVAPPSSNTYPQIVRIRYAEGDVRVTRGKDIEKSAGTVWEQATTGLPLETGFTLVTTTGRAEIEFEDASTLYLADNSALQLEDIRTTSGIPHTTLSLLTGTATVHLHTVAAGEAFVIKTPTDSITIAYPEKLYARITSYLDAIAITPQKDETFYLTGIAPQNGVVGKTEAYNYGRPVSLESVAATNDFAPWDAWVQARVTLRSAALASVTASSGLPASTPGLADRANQGAFFSCAPYGTCWEPPADTEQSQLQAPGIPTGPDFNIFLAPDTVTVAPGDNATTKLSAVAFGGFASPIDIATSLPAGITCVRSCSGQLAFGSQAFALRFAVAASVAPGSYPVTVTATSGTILHTITFTIYVMTSQVDALPFLPEIAPYYPCFPEGVRPITLSEHLRSLTLHYGYGPFTHSYDWAVCHTGAWIFRSNIYVWVVPKGAERRRHHHRPVHWIKTGKNTGYVPRHPRDVTGKPPVNRKHEIYNLGDRNGSAIDRTTVDLNDKKNKLEVLNEPPKEFRKPEPVPLVRADEPSVVAHALRSDTVPTRLAFDSKTQKLVFTSDHVEDGRSATFNRPVESHGGDLRIHDNHIEAHAPHVSTPHLGGGSHTGGASHVGGSHSGGGHAGGGSHGGGHSGGSHSGGGHH
ncbi:FecR domain-containing protein [Granulicella sp. S156]|uniref:FecR domain-containing protein n=1 Tax=Granulicella sp. S156 TaxID=1747224 RepID=UPI00131EBCC4|nr:FecR domain-containing protein [Granulicella sp. S156]